MSFWNKEGDHGRPWPLLGLLSVVPQPSGKATRDCSVIHQWAVRAKTIFLPSSFLIIACCCLSLSFNCCCYPLSSLYFYPSFVLGFFFCFTNAFLSFLISPCFTGWSLRHLIIGTRSLITFPFFPTSRRSLANRRPMAVTTWCIFVYILDAWF